MEPSPEKVTSSVHEEDGVPFMVMRRAPRLVGSSILTPPTPLLAPKSNDLMPIGPASVALTTTREDVVRFRNIYGIPNHIRVFAPDLDDKVTSRSKGGIALYKGCLHAGL